MTLRTRARPTLGATLAAKLIRYRYRSTVVLIMAGTLTSGLLSFFIAVGASSDQAEVDGTRAGVAGRPYSLQAGSEYARAALSRVSGLDVVKDSPAQVSSGTATTDVLLREVNRPRLPLFSLVSGRRAARAGEATISDATATTLSLKTDDSATIIASNRRHQVRIVGITRDPSTLADSSVVELNPRLTSTRATLWLSKTDPYANPGLRQLMDARAITYRPTASLAEAAVDARSAARRVVRISPLVLAPVLILLSGAVVAAQLTVARRDFAGLTAVGMSQRGAWRLLSFASAACLSTGIVLGAAAARLTLTMVSTPTAALFDQAWSNVAFKWSPVLALLGLTWSAAFAARPATVGWRIVTQRVALLRVRRNASLLNLGLRASIGGVLLGLAIAASRLQSPPAFMAMTGLAGALSVVSAVPGLVVLAISRSAGPATRVLLWNISAALRIVVAAAMMIALVAGTYSASQTHNVDASARITAKGQPVGSVLLTEVPSGAVEAMLSRYRVLGGDRWERFTLPSEQRQVLRVSSPRLVKCMERLRTLNPDDAPPECFPQRSFTPVAPVMLTRPGQRARADADLVQQGSVGLLYYDGPGAAAASIATTEAAGQRDLGGNMPGLIIPEAGSVAQRFGLQPSGAELLALMDFSKLSTRNQARMRSSFARLAPAAQVADLEAADPYEQDRRTAAATALGAAPVVGLMVLIGGLAAIVGETHNFRAVAGLGLSSRQARRLWTIWAAVPVAGMVIAVLLTRACTLAFETTLFGDRGSAWVLPGVTGLLFGASLAPLFLYLNRRREV